LSVSTKFFLEEKGAPVSSRKNSARKVITAAQPHHSDPWLTLKAPQQTPQTTSCVRDYIRVCIWGESWAETCSFVIQRRALCIAAPSSPHGQPLVCSLSSWQQWPKVDQSLHWRRWLDWSSPVHGVWPQEISYSFF
jgi:hypothetical protein